MFSVWRHSEHRCASRQCEVTCNDYAFHDSSCSMFIVADLKKKKASLSLQRDHFAMQQTRVDTGVVN